MQIVVQVLFFAAVIVISYVYFGYPLLLPSGLLGRRRLIERGPILPTVTVVIPAHNEESAIESKLENLLASDYPQARMEILVGADGCTDRTEEIVARYASRNVRLISFHPQRGKSGIQNDLAAQATGEVLLFTDADCLVSRDGIRILVSNFADPNIGLVTVQPCYSNVSETEVARNEGLYWRYESWIRAQESARGLLAAASGWFFGFRRSLWRPLDPNVGDDFVLPLRVAATGLRNVVDERLHVYSRLTQTHSSTMLRMKMRIVSKDLRGLMMNRKVLNPLRVGRIAIGLWSHKLLRWLVPYFLIGLFLSNLFLLEWPILRLLLAAQVGFYGIAGAGALLRRRPLRNAWSVPFSFCLVNTAALFGTIHCALGRTIGIWRPVR